MKVTCQQCGTEFDTDRDHAAGDYADTQRCPYCGQSHDIGAGEAEGTATETDGVTTEPTRLTASESVTVRITIEVVPDG